MDSALLHMSAARTGWVVKVDKKGNGTFDNIFDNIKNIKKKNPRFYKNNIRYNAVIAPPFNYDELLKFFNKDNVNFLDIKLTKEFLKEIGKSEDELNKSSIKTEYDVSKSPMLFNFIKQLKKYNMIAFDGSGQIIGCAGFCSPFERKIFVNSQGNYLLCERIYESNDLYNLGNVFEGINYLKIKQIFRFQEKIYNENCIKCWAVRLCKACFVNDKEINYKGNFCKEMRNEIEKEFSIYIDLIKKNTDYFTLFENMSLD